MINLAIVFANVLLLFLFYRVIKSATFLVWKVTNTMHAESLTKLSVLEEIQINIDGINIYFILLSNMKDCTFSQNVNFLAQ